MIQTQEQRKYRMAGRVVLRRIGKDQLLVPVTGSAARANCVFPVNQTGVFMWERLAAGKSLEETAREVSLAFQVGIPAALADAAVFLQSLVEQQLLEEMAA